MPKKFSFAEMKMVCTKRGGCFRYEISYLVRAAGIEPASNAWEAFILPLNYARFCLCSEMYQNKQS